jgi:hypothetical protein
MINYIALNGTTVGYFIEHGFKPEMTWNENEFASWAKRDMKSIEDRVFIVLLLNDKNNLFSGLHYVMIKSDENGTYTTYNLLDTHTNEMPNRSLSTIIGDGAFISGFYLPKLGGK